MCLSQNLLTQQKLYFSWLINFAALVHGVQYLSPTVAEAHTSEGFNSRKENINSILLLQPLTCDPCPVWEKLALLMTYIGYMIIPFRGNSAWKTDPPLLLHLLRTMVKKFNPTLKGTHPSCFFLYRKPVRYEMSPILLCFSHLKQVFCPVPCNSTHLSAVDM